MHGAANDFVLIDDRAQTFPVGRTEWLARIMARRTGVGSEGMLLIQPSAKADIRMRFFNPDGGEADMCGNGARCIARLAHEIGAAPASMSIETPAGIVRADVRGDQVLLHMTEPKDWRMSRTLTIDNQPLACSFVNTGVPHAVVSVENLDAIDVQKMGSRIRYHADFAPAGTNANFIQVTGPDSLRVRTYERGVEGETLACGTGMVAAVIAAAQRGLVDSPVNVLARGGETLRVYFENQDGCWREIYLEGPVKMVYQGMLFAEAYQS